MLGVMIPLLEAGLGLALILGRYTRRLSAGARCRWAPVSAQDRPSMGD